MILLPAIDLRDGCCVQLVGGDYAAESVRLERPSAVARAWADMGSRLLHVVDLDAATDRGDNARAVQDVIGAAAQAGARVQVGGGVRDDAAVEALLQFGAARVVVGTRALLDTAWLNTAATRAPGRIVLAADVRDGRLQTNGWTQSIDRSLADIVDLANDIPLAAMLVTAVHAEGRMAGADLALLDSVVSHARLPVIASGGVGSIEDLRALATLGVHETIVGMALYTGAIDGRAAFAEFSQ